MKNKINNYLLQIKNFFIKLNTTIKTIFIWQLILTIIFFNLTNFIILIIIGVLFLLNLITFL